MLAATANKTLLKLKMYIFQQRKSAIQEFYLETFLFNIFHVTKAHPIFYNFTLFLPIHILVIISFCFLKIAKRTVTYLCPLVIWCALSTPATNGAIGTLFPTNKTESLRVVNRTYQNLILLNLGINLISSALF